MPKTASTEATPGILIANHDWSGVLIEGTGAYRKIADNHPENEKVHAINEFATVEGSTSLDNLLARTPIPKEFDLLCLDIDGNEWHVWDSLKQYEPKVVCVEFNPTVPNDVYFVQDLDFDVRQGNSLLALIELGKRKGYELVAATAWDGIFVRTGIVPAVPHLR